MLIQLYPNVTDNYLSNPSRQVRVEKLHHRLKHHQAHQDINDPQKSWFVANRHIIVNGYLNEIRSGRCQYCQSNGQKNQQVKPYDIRLYKLIKFLKNL